MKTTTIRSLTLLTLVLTSTTALVLLALPFDRPPSTAFGGSVDPLGAPAPASATVIIFAHGVGLDPNGLVRVARGSLMDPDGRLAYGPAMEPNGGAAAMRLARGGLMDPDGKRLTFGPAFEPHGQEVAFAPVLEPNGARIG